MDKPSFIANGNILPSSIVKQDATQAMPNVVQSTSTSDVCIGISKESTDQAPTPQLSGTQYAAVAGENCHVYQVAEVCMLNIGAVGVTAGDMISNDGGGLGATAAPGSGKRVIALALFTTPAATLCRVRVTDPFIA